MTGSGFVRACGVVALWAALLAIPADVLSWFLAPESYSPIRQTISALAVGRASWLIDLGVLSFALACMALGAGMRALPLSRWWTSAAVAVVGTGAAAAVIAFVNQYAGEQNPGANIHMWMVYAIYGLFAIAALGSASDMEARSRGVAAFSRLAGWSWIVLGPLYYFWFPAGWAGAFERALVLLVIAWLACMARHLSHANRIAEHLGR